MSEELTFDGQRVGERVIVVWRKHPWVLSKPGLMVVIVVLLIAASLKFFSASAVSSFAIMLGLIVIGAVAGSALFRWWNGLYILTTERLIDVDQRSLFHRVVGELPIEHIQDVAYEVKGPLATVLNYGNVVVQTIGGGTTITMEIVEAPHVVQQEVLSARNDYVRAHPDQAA